MATTEKHAVVARSLPVQPLTGAAAWTGAQMAGDQGWLRTLGEHEVREIEAAAADSRSRGVDLIALSRDNFMLPQVGPMLEDIRDELENGRGFVVLRGLPVSQHSIEFNARMYLGIGAYIGKPVSQNAMGHLLGHVIDIGREEDDPSARIYQTSARQYYHADSCDVVALLCLRKARRGGLSSIVSSVTLFNEVLARRPDLVEVLARPFQVDRRGEVPAGRKPWSEIPIFNWYEGKLSTYCVPRYIESARRFDGVPPLSAGQVEALELIKSLCDDPRLHLQMDFEPGDIQLLHNPQILHDRTAFEDWPEPERRRHLLRLWLCTPNGRPLPPCYADRWGRVEVGDRGGIHVPGTSLNVPLHPC